MLLSPRYHAASGGTGTGTTHSLLLALPAVAAAPNAAAEDLVLDFSMAYFAVDLAAGALPPAAAGRGALHRAPPRHALRPRHLPPRRRRGRGRAAAAGGARGGHERRAERVDAGRHAPARLAAGRQALRPALAAVLRCVHRRQGRPRAGLVRQDGRRLLLRVVLRRRRPRAGVGVVHGRHRRRDSGEHPVGGQPVARVLQGKEQGKQAAVIISAALFPFTHIAVGSEFSSRFC